MHVSYNRERDKVKDETPSINKTSVVHLMLREKSMKVNNVATDAVWLIRYNIHSHYHRTSVFSLTVVVVVRTVQ